MSNKDVFLWFDPFKCKAFQDEIAGYARWVEERLVPSFGNWEDDFVREADRIAETGRYQFEGGEENVAEDALSFCSQLAEINSYMLGMSIVGLSHLWERQFISFLNGELRHYCRSSGSEIKSMRNVDECCKLFDLDIGKKTFPLLYELREVANAIKHGEGRSYDKLKRMKSDILTKNDEDSFRNLDFDSNLISGEMSMLRIAIHPTFEHFIKFKEAVYSFWDYGYWAEVGERCYLTEEV